MDFVIGFTVVMVVFVGCIIALMWACSKWG